MVCSINGWLSNYILRRGADKRKLSKVSLSTLSRIHGENKQEEKERREHKERSFP